MGVRYGRVDLGCSPPRSVGIVTLKDRKLSPLFRGKRTRCALRISACGPKADTD